MIYIDIYVARTTQAAYPEIAERPVSTLDVRGGNRKSQLPSMSLSTYGGCAGSAQPAIEFDLCSTPVTSNHPGGNPWKNRKSISHRCHPILVAFVWELTQETINLPLDCLQGGVEADLGGRTAAPGLGRERGDRKRAQHFQALHCLLSRDFT